MVYHRIKKLLYREVKSKQDEDTAHRIGGKHLSEYLTED